jgi:hypothetical protein
VKIKQPKTPEERAAVDELDDVIYKSCYSIGANELFSDGCLALL